MGEVEVCDVHASAEELLEHGDGAGGRADGADELGLGHPRVEPDALQVREDHHHVDVGHGALHRGLPQVRVSGWLDLRARWQGERGDRGGGTTRGGRWG
jgi:hypothetical protein